MRSGFQSAYNAMAFFVCATLVAALVLPSIARHRSFARAQSCANNLKHIGLAFHNYHSAYKRLPMGYGGTDSGEDPTKSNQGRLGPLVGILPFCEQQRLWEQIANPYTSKTGAQFPPMGPVPWYDEKIYTPWQQVPAVYLCPENGVQPNPNRKQQVVFTLASASGAGVLSNYVSCHGDGTYMIGQKFGPDNQKGAVEAMAGQRGAFCSTRVTRFLDTMDGTAYTLMYSETRASLQGKADNSGIAKDVAGFNMNPSLCLTAGKNAETKWWEFGRGSRWCDGQVAITGFQTVLPPNSVSCTSERGVEDVIASASSDHAGGVHALFMDGRVAFVAGSIDTGDLTKPGVAWGPGYTQAGRESPYGIWGAMGTRASKETWKDTHKLSKPLMPILFGRHRGEIRLWSDKTGETNLSALFVRIIDRKTIELEDSQGILHQVPLNSLSDQDIYHAVELDLSEKAGTK